MKRSLLLLTVLMVFSSRAWTRQTQNHDARGLVLKVDPSHRTVLVSCDRIPDYMDAMVMSFDVRNVKELEGVGPGTMIDFSLVANSESVHIENIRIHRYQSVEPDPLGARRLKLMSGIADPSLAAQIKVGDRVPDFTLIDQNRQPVSLSQFKGTVVAITFTYTHCVLPNFCFRISNNFRRLQNRFASQMGKDLVLLTITFDPAHDTPEEMAKYGKTWNVNPKGWRLLSGSVPDVEKICHTFGLSFWPDEGVMVHSLHTILVDRNGNLSADIEGNEYNADQLGDLVQTLMVGTMVRTAHGPPQRVMHGPS